MRTSTQGIAFIERHEGVVLRAYRDPVGVWTIGAGLTASSGVVAPKQGMKITSAQATELLNQALRRNYEPGVARAMPGAVQREFDGGVSFHFNTGAIGRASWVKAWKARDWVAVEQKIMQWVKGGRRVLPGLVSRRRDELNLIRFGVYDAGRPIPSPVPGTARITLDLSAENIAALRKAFGALGYDPGKIASGVAEAAVRAFQRDHDLTVDGIIGRATLSTVERRIGARIGTRTAGVVTGGGGAVTVGAPDTQPAWEAATSAGWVVLGLGALWLVWLAWRYRDVLAVKVQHKLPGLAAWLRRI